MIRHNVQQGSWEWRILRCGMVTGSCLKDVFKASNLDLIDTLISEQLTETWEDTEYVSEAMQRGLDMEPEAIERYGILTGVEVDRCGFLQSERWPLLGYSPDGCVGETGGVEVKCPSSKRHCQYLRMGGVPNEYKWQVYGAFLVNDSLEWNDFMSYDPRVSQRPEYIYRTYRKDIIAELDTAAVELDKFFEKLEKYKSKILFPVDATKTI